MISLSENIAKSFRGDGTFWVTLYVSYTYITDERLDAQLVLSKLEY